MSRRLTVVVAVCVAVAALIGASLWALPEVVRRVAVSRIAELTGRATTIERVEINVFTGRFAVKRFAVARRPGHGPEAFVEFDRLDGRLALSALLGFDVRLAAIRLARPTIRVTRTGPARFDFTDLLDLFTAPVRKEEAPSRFTFSVDRLEVADGTIVMDDVFLSPPVQWRLEDLGIETSGLTTKPDRPAGALRVGARLGDASLGASSASVRLTPFDVSAEVSLTDFDLARVRPYLPADVVAIPEAGKVGLTLRIDRVRAGEALTESSLAGAVRVSGLSVIQPGRPAPFLRLDRLEVAVKRTDFLAREVTIEAVEVDGLDLKVTRDKQGEIDLLAPRRPPPDAPGATGADRSASPAPSPAAASAAPPEAPRGPPEAGLGRIRLERLALRSGTVTVTDEAVSPARQWTLEDVTVEGAGFSNVPDDAAATLKVRTRVTGRPGFPRPATLEVDADSIRVAPLAGSARVKLDGFALAALRPYWPESVPAVAPEGTAGLAIGLDVAQGEDGQLRRAVVSGSARLDGLEVVQRGQPAPFLRVPKLTVEIKQVDAIARAVALGVVGVDGADLRAVREAGGRIDLLGMAGTAQPAIEVIKSKTGLAVETAPAPPPGAGQWRVSLERFVLAKSTLAFEDRDVSSPTTLALTDVALAVERAAWPFTRPATFTLSVAMPAGGRTEGKGTVVLEPLNLQVALSTRESPIAPYQAYFPFEARFLGSFSGDSLSEIQRGPNGELIVASRGTAWASNLEVRAPGVSDPVARMDAMAIRDIDFSWPNYAVVERVVLTHPQVRVERDAQGAINLATLFTPRQAGARPDDQSAPAAASPPAEGRDGGAATPAGQSGPLQTMVIDFNALEIENGSARFIDHTTAPPFSEEISRLALTVRGLSNVPGRPERTTLTAQALVGSDGTLDMQGDLSGLGEALRADLTVDLRDVSLPSANPYADSLVSWTVQRGTLQAKIHYHLEGDRLAARHDLELKKLQVQKSRDSDQAKRRLGVPLGLAVALLKDSNGNIDFSLPLNGTLSDKNFDWGELIWAGVKQVIVKVLLSPFSALGRLVKGGDDSVDQLVVDPVTFAPGSAAIAPAAEAQLGRVADFLRRSPQIKVSLAPVVTAADLDSLKGQEVAVRLEAFRREQGLPDQSVALRAYYEQKLPGVSVPQTAGEQLALLVSQEPAPEGRVAELARQRIEATRDSLVKGRGIPDGRVGLPAGPAGTAPAGDGPGRVEFAIAPIDG